MKYVLKKARRIIGRDIVTGKHKFTMVELKSVSLTDGQETLWAEGTDGARLAGFDSGKIATIKAESGVLSTGVLEVQTGGTMTTVSSGSGILIREEFTLAAGALSTITLTYLASGTVGGEIKWIYKADATGEPDTANAIAQGSTAESQFSYAAATGIITLPTSGMAAGDVIIVDYYPTFDSYTELTNNNTNFSTTCEIYVDGYWTDLSTQADVALQLYCPAGKVSGAFDFSFGDAVAVQSIEIEALATQKAGHVGDQWTLRSYDLTDADKAS